MKKWETLFAQHFNEEKIWLFTICIPTFCLMSNRSSSFLVFMSSTSTSPLVGRSIALKCFARVDSERRAEMMKILSGEGMPQAIVFTCRPEDVPASDAGTVML